MGLLTRARAASKAARRKRGGNPLSRTTHFLTAALTISCEKKRMRRGIIHLPRWSSDPQEVTCTWCRRTLAYETTVRMLTARAGRALGKQRASALNAAGKRLRSFGRDSDGAA